jgi:hypothetical protein
LIGYLGPVRYAYTVAVIVKMLIAGTGAYALSRVIGIGRLPAALAGTAFELSGAFTAWSGWPQTGVFCWLGWLLAFSILIVRGQHRRRDTCLLAGAFALALLGGHPESVGISAIVVVVTLIPLLVASVRKSGPAGLWSPGGHLIGAVAIGFAIASPVVLPAAQIVNQSVHRSLLGYGGMAPSRAVNLAFAQFYGLPTTTGHYSDLAVTYYDSAGYVGIVILVLAVVAVATQFRQPAILGLTVSGLLMAAIAYIPRFTGFLLSLPFAKLVLWDRVLIPLDLILSVLAGAGLHLLMVSHRRRAVRHTFAGAAALAAVAVLGLGLRQILSPLPEPYASVRARSFIVPSVTCALLLALAGVMLLRPTVLDAPLGSASGRHRRSSRGISRAAAVGALLAMTEVVFLLTATPNLWSSSKRYFPTTVAEARLQQLVGSARVGFGDCPTIALMASLGVLPEANSGYQISELSAYDPIVPKSYFTSPLLKATNTPSAGSFGQFCPSVDSAQVARRYGVAFILEPAGHSPPPGTDLVATIGGEDVYKVPDSGLVVLAGPDSASTIVSNAPGGNPAQMRFHVHALAGSTLLIHITDLPGWSATFNGHKLPLHPLDSMMMQASIGPGDGTVVLVYRPSLYSLGLKLAALAVILTIGWLFAPLARTVLRDRKLRRRNGT